jgi:Zn-dependent metalloprotease
MASLRALLGLPFVLAASLAMAADLHSLRPDSQLLDQLRGTNGSVADPAFRAALGLGANERLEALRSYPDARGGEVTRYRQTFLGVPVWGEQVVIGRDAAGFVESLHGRAVRGLAQGLQGVRPTLTAGDALINMQEKVQALFGSEDLHYRNEKSELVIYLDNGSPVLSYAVSFFADTEAGGRPTRPTFIVDADSGDVLFEYEGLTHAEDPIHSESGISGSRRTWWYKTLPTLSNFGDRDMLEISISGGSGDADLYTRLGANPTTSTYDCRPYLAGNNEDCGSSANSGDSWHVGLYPYRNFSGVTLTARLITLTPADGTGPGGNSKTGQYQYGGSSQNFDPLDVGASGVNNNCYMNNPNVKTVDLNNGTSGSLAYKYDCLDPADAINEAFSPLNDAHYFGGVVFDMYQAYMNTAPLTFQLMMRVHYSTNYENAFWDGSSMTFGDGASTFYPLVALDVSAHEVSHGFTEQNSNLIYSGESGGINEAFSDIAGEAAEYFMHRENMHRENDFLVGWEIFKSPTGALRYMCNPPQDGKSIGNVANYYNGLDVHYSSGIYNKAFCELAKTSGWTTESAFRAFATANQQYWTPSTGFQEGAQGVVDAADDLGFDPQNVADAFAVVGITGLVLPGEPPAAPPTPANLRACAVSDSRIDLCWSDVSGEDGYRILSRTGSNGFSEVGSVAANTTAFSHMNLVDNTVYDYQVIAYNDGGDSAPATMSATTDPAPDPGAITLTASGYKVKGVQHAELTWEPSTTEVNIFRNSDPLTSYDGSGSPWVDNIGVKGAGTYEYKVCEIGSDTCATATVVF